MELCSIYGNGLMASLLPEGLLRVRGGAAALEGAPPQSRASLHLASADISLCDLQNLKMLRGYKRLLNSPSSCPHLHKAFISLL